MTLDDVRVNIDRVDKQIKELFQERMELADQVACVKAQTGDNIFKPDREVKIISNLTEDIEPGIKREYVALLKRIMEVSRKYYATFTTEEDRTLLQTIFAMASPRRTGSATRTCQNTSAASDCREWMHCAPSPAKAAQSLVSMPARKH